MLRQLENLWFKCVNSKKKHQKLFEWNNEKDMPINNIDKKGMKEYLTIAYFSSQIKRS